MYACILEIGRGFFEGVCAPSNATAYLRDPPPPRNAREPEPWQCGSDPKRITRRPTVSDDLAHPKLVQDLLGHASVDITLDTYSHMLPGMRIEAADAMGEAIA